MMKQFCVLPFFSGWSAGPCREDNDVPNAGDEGKPPVPAPPRAQRRRRPPRGQLRRGPRHGSEKVSQVRQPPKDRHRAQARRHCRAPPDGRRQGLVQPAAVAPQAQHHVSPGEGFGEQNLQVDQRQNVTESEFE